MGLEHERLLSLIDFAKESAKLKSTPTCDAASHPFCEYEHNLQDMPGVHFNVGGEEDEIWLVVDRLREKNAPSPNNPLLKLWLEVSNSPTKEPVLRGSVEFSKLMEAGFIKQKEDPESANVKSVVLLEDFQQMAEVESLLRTYISTQWMSWAIEERKRRRSIQLYGKLFTLKQQLDGSITDAQVEVAWGVGIAVWNMGRSKVCYPLVSRLVDISINELTMAIEIRPRDLDTRLELDVYTTEDNHGTVNLEKIYKDFIAKSTQTFSPFDSSTFDGILRSAVACLDSKGIYWPAETTSDDRKLPAASEALKVTDTWVLLARPRSKNLFIQDLERFKSDLENDAVADLPKAIMAILTEPSNVNEDVTLPVFRGISMLQGHDGNHENAGKKVSDLYFPMAFNDEQVRIVQLLERHDGVVVQGPPGTGKTHTIANIISHYFALGKRVLVTSMKEPALAVLRDKLPEEIRPLAISLLSNEQEGMKQFEQAISRIAAEIQVIDKNTYRKEIKQLEQDIDSLHGRLANIDRKVMEWAKKNLNPIIMDKESIMPVDAANEVVSGQGQYEWLEDELIPENAPKFDNMDIARLREARSKVSGDMHYLGTFLPEIAIFPDSRELVRVHQDLSRHSEIEAAIQTGNLPPLADSQDGTIESAAMLLGKVENLFSLTQKIQNAGKWNQDACKLLKQSPDSLLSIIKIFDSLGAELKSAITERNTFLARPVNILKDAETDDEIILAIKNKAAGKSPFGLSGIIGKSAAKKKLDEILIVTSVPSSQDDWKHVEAFVTLQRRFRELVTRWNSIAPELGCECFDSTDPLHALKAEESHALHILLRDHVTLEKEVITQSRELMPTWTRHAEIEKNVDCLQELQRFLESHISRQRLSSAWAKKEQVQQILSEYKSQITDELKIFAASTLGNPSITDANMQGKWSSLLDELKRIQSLRGAFADIQDVCSRIKESGGKKWGEALLIQPVSTTIDPFLPDNWQKSRRLRRLATYLQKADAGEELKKLTHERNIAETRLTKTYKDIVAKYTWLKLAENATPDIRAALEAFRTAVTKIGKGTGKRAVIFRQNARNASERANRAIPCWIMPHWRVSESLPAQLGCFDLVIIDEASQSDFDALPALLRAKKVLIVGDDKQVSPDGGFIDIDRIQNLKSRYLANQVDIFRAQMDPAISIYDLFKVVFSQSGTMLREHFRCVGPIIEYSKREVYNHELKPVRLPKASERLDPPLIDVLIEDGFRKGDINLPEARFIVDEIKKICADENLSKRTIGVVSLLADKQALKIWEMLETELGSEEIKNHEISCGDARTFQGKERDIMFLSMVVSPGEAHAQTRDSTAQRFNVAASRARDRMYLVRSVEIDQLSINDKLRRKLISHFTTPYAQDEQRVDNLRSLCESDFEKEIYDILVERGYRVTPQVKVGEYRIDMIVEGHNDTRLAIECDGDRYHGADRWESDMHRQRVLERVGWQFWRSFASTFVRNRKEVIGDLISTLKERGIEPIGNSAAPRSIHTEHRRVTISAVEITDIGEKDSQKDISTLQLSPDYEMTRTDSLTQPKDKISVIKENTQTINEGTVYIASGTQDAVIHIKTATPYLPAQMDDIIPLLVSDDFHASRENVSLSDLISRIITSEGPIPLELLAERVARAYAFKRTGNKIVDRVRKIAAKQFPSHKEKGQEFFWPSSKIMSSYQSFRTTIADSEHIRKIEHICLQELRALADYVSVTNLPTNEEEHIRLMAEQLGYRRITENIANQLRNAIGEILPQEIRHSV